MKGRGGSRPGGRPSFCALRKTPIHRAVVFLLICRILFYWCLFTTPVEEKTRKGVARKGSQICTRSCVFPDSGRPDCQQIAVQMVVYSPPEWFSAEIPKASPARNSYEAVLSVSSKGFPVFRRKCFRETAVIPRRPFRERFPPCFTAIAFAKRK